MPVFRLLHMALPADFTAWATMAVGAGIGVAATVATAFWSAKISRRIAAESGAFRRSDLKILLLAQELTDTPDGVNHWCFIAPRDGKKPSVYPFDFQVANGGDAASGELVVTLTGPKQLFVPPSVSIERSITPAVLEDSFRRAASIVGQQGQVSYVLPSLAPAAAAAISEPVILSSTHARTAKVQAETSDRVEVQIELQYSMSMILTISVMPLNSPIRSRTIQLSCIPAGDMDAARHLLIQDLTSEFNQRYSSLSWLQRFALLLQRRDTLTYSIAHFGDPTPDQSDQSSIAYSFPRGQSIAIGKVSFRIHRSIHSS